MAKNSRRRRRRDEISNLRLPTTDFGLRAAVTDLKYVDGLARAFKTDVETLVEARFFEPSVEVREPGPQPNVNKPQQPYRAPSLYTNVQRGGRDRNLKTVCEERSERREVMFATNKAGRSGQKTPRFTAKSKVRCK